LQLGRAFRAQWHAEGHHRQAQCGVRRGTGRSGRSISLRCSGNGDFPARPADTGGARRLAEGRYREMVAAHQGVRDQGRVRKRILGSTIPRADVSREGVQRYLLPLIEGTTVSTKHGSVKTNHRFLLPKPRHMQLIILVEWGNGALACRLCLQTPGGDHVASITIPPLISSMRWEPRSEHATTAFPRRLGWRSCVPTCGAGTAFCYAHKRLDSRRGPEHRAGGVHLSLSACDYGCHTQALQQHRGGQEVWSRTNEQVLARAHVSTGHVTECHSRQLRYTLFVELARFD